MGAAISSLLFPVPQWRRRYFDTLTRSPNFRWVDTRTAKRTPALYIKHPTAQYTLLYTHGNAEDLGELLPMLPHMSESCNASVFAVEYPGYSISEAEKPTEELCYEAVEGAYEHLIEKEGVPASAIIPFGRSLGSGPAVHIASLKKPKGLVLQSPLESGARAVMNKFFGYVGWFVDPFPNYRKVDDLVNVTTCIIHGTADTVVPCHNGQGLYDALKEKGKVVPPLWIEGRGHNDMPPERVFARVKQFLTQELDK